MIKYSVEMMLIAMAFVVVPWDRALFYASASTHRKCILEIQCWLDELDVTCLGSTLDRDGVDGTSVLCLIHIQVNGKVWFTYILQLMDAAWMYTRQETLQNDAPFKELVSYCVGLLNGKDGDNAQSLIHTDICFVNCKGHALVTFGATGYTHLQTASSISCSILNPYSTVWCQWNLMISVFW